MIIEHSVQCQFLHDGLSFPRLKSANLNHKQSFDVARKVKARIGDGCYEEDLPEIENGIYLQTKDLYNDNEHVQVRCLDSSEGLKFLKTLALQESSRSPLLTSGIFR